jgi:hypothetical protein
MTIETKTSRVKIVVALQDLQTYARYGLLLQCQTGRKMSSKLMSDVVFLAHALYGMKETLH